MNNSTNQKCSGSRACLLASASSIAIILSASASNFASADDSKPTLWLEEGFDVLNIGESVKEVGLPLGSTVSPSGLTAPLSDSLSFGHSNSGEGKIIFQPEGSDWVFSASVRYGRANGKKSHIKQALAPIPTASFTSYKFTYPFYPSSNKARVRNAPATAEKLGENSSNAESHLIVDFDVGKDVGLGLFGRGGTSVFSAGVRFANFSVSRKSNLHETNGIHFSSSHFATFTYPGYGTRRRELWDLLSANGSTTQSFHGLGPSIKWDASATLWHGPRGGDISLDWGANAALLFGRQKEKIAHQSSVSDQCAGSNCPAPGAPIANSDSTRSSRNITVPNVGGFMGITLSYSNIDMNFGYRADWFSGVTDAGLASRKSSNMLLLGPYASISVGLGD